MALPPLIYRGDLDEFPGAPFTQAMVDIACASVRAEARWHIAPVATMTVTVQSFGGTDLRLPSRRVLSVSEVRDVTTGTPYVITGWTRVGATLIRTISGLAIGASDLLRTAGWPAGTLEVDLVHGYDETPLDLLPVIARKMAAPPDPNVKSYQTTRGPFTEQKVYRDTLAGVDPVIARYGLLPGVA